MKIIYLIFCHPNRSSSVLLKMADLQTRIILIEDWYSLKSIYLSNSYRENRLHIDFLCGENNVIWQRGPNTHVQSAAIPFFWPWRFLPVSLTISPGQFDKGRILDFLSNNVKLTKESRNWILNKAYLDSLSHRDLLWKISVSHTHTHTFSHCSNMFRKKGNFKIP